MIIPWGTDAPIYHWPFATVGLIVFTILVFFITGPAEYVGVNDWELEEAQAAQVEDALKTEEAEKKPAKADAKAEPEEDDEPMPGALVGMEPPGLTEGDRQEIRRRAWVQKLVLSYGRGLHPTQWVSSIFLHGNFGHLIGNMLFLWAFGIVVEGKLGWWRFILVYLGVGAGESAIEQLIMLGNAHGQYSVGASAAIYGLLAMCLVWAPRNDLNCWAFFNWRSGMFGEWDIPIILFATFYIALEGLTVFVSGFALSSSFLHLLGAIWGFVVATILLNMGIADCEGWDLYNVLRRTQGQKARKKKKRRKKAADAEPEPTAEEKLEEARESLRRAIAENHTGAALALDQKARQSLVGWETPEPELMALIKLLHKDSRWTDSMPLMEEYARRFSPSSKAAQVQLKLAQILLREQQRPAQALRVLSEIAPESLPASLRPARQQLEQKAIRMRDEGVLELEGESW